MPYTPPKKFEWNYCGTCGKKLIIAHDGQSDRPHCPDCNRFYYKNPVPAACCFVQRNKDELLFVQRAVQPCKGEWTLPGGFIELNETAQEAALRELHEETNLTGSSPQLIGLSTNQNPNWGAVLVIGFLVKQWTGEKNMRPDTDTMDLRFFPREERPKMPFPVHQDLLNQYDQQFPPKS